RHGPRAVQQFQTLRDVGAYQEMMIRGFKDSGIRGFKDSGIRRFWFLGFLILGLAGPLQGVTLAQSASAVKPVRLDARATAPVRSSGNLPVYPEDAKLKHIG